MTDDLLAKHFGPFFRHKAFFNALHQYNKLIATDSSDDIILPEILLQ